MTRLGRASALLGVFAGDFAILMLINGQLTDFDVSAGVCAVALLGAALFEYVSDATHAPLGLTSPQISRPLGIHRPGPKDHPLGDGDGGARAANVVIELWIAATAAAQPETGAGEQRRRGIEETMMSTVLGMLMMMPVVLGVGGYALVSRRP